MTDVITERHHSTSSKRSRTRGRPRSRDRGTIIVTLMQGCHSVGFCHTSAMFWSVSHRSHSWDSYTAIADGLATRADAELIGRAEARRRRCAYEPPGR